MAPWPSGLCEIAAFVLSAEVPLGEGPARWPQLPDQSASGREQQGKAGGVAGAARYLTVGNVHGSLCVRGCFPRIPPVLLAACAGGLGMPQCSHGSLSQSDRANSPTYCTHSVSLSVCNMCAHIHIHTHTNICTKHTYMQIYIQTMHALANIHTPKHVHVLCVVDGCDWCWGL